MLQVWRGNAGCSLVEGETRLATNMRVNMTSKRLEIYRRSDKTISKQNSF
jgi:hypothetical protein